MKKQFLFGVFFFQYLLIFSQGFPEQTWDTITFEKPLKEVIMNDIPENIWQIGKPSKTFFDTAFSISNAMVTDTLNSYPSNNYSYFDLHLSNENVGWYSTSVSVEFQHKFDTDTLKDGGFITVSYDMGATWKNIIDDLYGFDPSGNFNNQQISLNAYNHSDSLINGNFGFSGHSNGWITTRISKYLIPVKNSIWDTDTTILRFNFISDGNQTNKEGWMIDNIRLYSCDFGPGLVFENTKKIEFQVFPNPFNAQTTIKLDKKHKTVESRVYNLQGKLMQTQKDFNCDNIIINRAKLTKGVYLIKLIYDNFESGTVLVEVVD